MRFLIWIIVTVLLVAVLVLSRMKSEEQFFQTEDSVLYYNCNLWTFPLEHTVKGAFIVQNGKFLWVGESKEDAPVLPGIKEVNLHGNTVVPGFIDSHTHVLLRGMTSVMTDVNSLKYTWKEAYSILKKSVQEEKQGVIAFGYDPSILVSKGDTPPELTRKVLDSISSTVPILVIHMTGHVTYANTPALTLVKSKTVDFDLGRAFELPAELSLLLPVMNKISFWKNMDYPRLMRDTLQSYAIDGWTCVTEMSLGIPIPNSAVDNIDLYQKICNEKSCPVRVHAYMIQQEQDKALKFRKTDKFQVSGVKLWSDGSLQVETGALESSYSEPVIPSRKSTERGFLDYPQDELIHRISDSHSKGLQIAVHANGDRAIKETLSAFQIAQEKLFSPDPRFRIEHATIANTTTWEKFRDIGVTPSFTVAHMSYYTPVFERILGEARASHVDTLDEAKEVGLPFSLNDDAPLANITPLQMLSIVCSRKTHNVDLATALCALTIYPAWQLFREKEIGSIEVGKLADFTVLSRDPFSVPVDQIAEMCSVVGTVVGGRKIN